MSKRTPEVNAKKLEVKYATERDALVWALDKAFEVAKEEMDTDDVFHFGTLRRLARLHELGDSERWERLSDEIHELRAEEDKQADEEAASYAELAGDIERDEK